VSSDQPGADADDTDKPTMAPFIGALVVIVLVVIGIVVVDAVGGNDLTPEQTVSRAVIGQNDALQRKDYARFRDYTCAAAQRDESSVLADQQKSVDANGERYVDGVDDVRIDGSTATASVTYSFGNARDDTTTTTVALVDEGGAWKVCQV